LGEDRSVGGHLRYFYDPTGIAGIRHNGENYKFIRDAHGNISKILHVTHRYDAVRARSTIDERLVAEYDYDSFGNHTITAYDSNHNIIVPGENHVASFNPWRWKGHYFDIESSMYYINGRYYDSVIGHYVDADDVENLISNAFTLNALDRNGVTVDNILSALPNMAAIFFWYGVVSGPLRRERIPQLVVCKLASCRAVDSFTVFCFKNIYLLNNNKHIICNVAFCSPKLIKVFAPVHLSPQQRLQDITADLHSFGRRPPQKCFKRLHSKRREINLLIIKEYLPYEN